MTRHHANQYSGGGRALCIVVPDTPPTEEEYAASLEQRRIEQITTEGAARIMRLVEIAKAGNAADEAL